MRGAPQPRKKTWWQSLLLGLLSVGLAVSFWILAMHTYAGPRSSGTMLGYALFLSIFYLPLELVATIVPGNYLLHAAWYRVWHGQKRPFFLSYSMSWLWLLLGALVLLVGAAQAGSNGDVFPFLALLYAWPLAVWLYCILAKVSRLY